MAIIEIDPRVQAMFDENVAKTRRANEEITAHFKAEQSRIAAEAKVAEEKFAKQREELVEKSKELSAAEKPRRTQAQWDRGDRPTGELYFDVESDEVAAPKPAPEAAPSPWQPAQTVPTPAARPQPRRHAAPDEDDDFGGQTWLT